MGHNFDYDIGSITALQEASASDCLHKEVYSSSNMYMGARRLAERGASWFDEYDVVILEGNDAESILLAQMAGNEIKRAYEPSISSQIVSMMRHPVKALHGQDIVDEGERLDYTVWQKGCILERRSE